jgi:hypothetical protein
MHQDKSEKEEVVDGNREKVKMRESKYIQVHGI